MLGLKLIHVSKRGPSIHAMTSVYFMFEKKIAIYNKSRAHKNWGNRENYLQRNSSSHKYRHCNDVIMGAIASHITSLTIVYSMVYSVADQRKHESSASLAFVRGIHREPVNSQHKWPVTRKMLPFDDVIMEISIIKIRQSHNHHIFTTGISIQKGAIIMRSNITW